MKNIFMLLLVLGTVGAGTASGSGGEELTAIVGVMKAREAATFPFWARVEFVDQRRGGTFWSNSYEGWMYHSDDALILRRTTWASNSPTAGAFDQKSHTRVERIDSVRAGAPPLGLSKPSSAPNTGWRGSVSIRRRMMDGGPPLISKFGLYWMRRRVSATIESFESAVIGRVKWRNFDCVRVVVDMARSRDEEAVRVPAPLVLWLSEGHGYYPVRAVFGSRVREPDEDDRSAGNSGSFEYRGHFYLPHLDYLVDELLSVHGTWFPVNAHERVLLPGGDAGRITCRVDPSSIHIGDIPPHLYSLIEVERAVVQDLASGERYFIGAHPYDVPEKELESLAEETRFSEHGLHPVSVPLEVPIWAYFAAAACSFALGILVRGRVKASRARRRRESRSASKAVLMVIWFAGAANASEPIHPMDRESWVPARLQSTSSKCGANCVFLALRGHGLPVALDELLAELAPRPGEKGVALNRLRDAIRSRGLHARIVEMTLSALQRTGHAAIVFLDVPSRRVLGHYVTVWPKSPSRASDSYGLIDPPNRLKLADSGISMDRVLPMMIFDDQPISTSPSFMSIAGMASIMVASFVFGVRNRDSSLGVKA